MNWHEVLRPLDETGAAREAAWASFRDRVEHLVVAILAGYPNAAVEAADLTQDIMVKLQDPRKLAMARATRDPEAYLAVVIRNAIVDALRRQEVERSVAGEWRPHEGAAADPAGAAVLSEILRDLEPEDRLLLHMRFEQDLTVPEIARRLGLTRSAVSVRLHRLLVRLRERGASGSRP